ncbi:DNA kinase/phosphatase Pnk1 [Stemphylium lycopersici]|uniref:DNA kinase/phosphatase Pnk1 n=1 Tax=Stemphylium lycopersici TaxID=183478 RepID=A0A364NBJ9_STELY|nr:hypothetical protein TW65_00768 [Stemphylium lycopersici]RAR11558.1 DNA kinase/phosphatase Pnk1 [Stemphylium lycopersici]RAR14685.1 DNA kinase/phosphatase Pnk1 [Stemphylium lycopersici]
MTVPPSLNKRTSSESKNLSPPPSKRRQQSAITSLSAHKAVASFFTPTSKKEPEKMAWRIVKDSLLVGRFRDATASTQPATACKRRIAAFDFDSTLITTASGKTFSRDANDWKWWDSSVPSRLKELHAEGFLIAIISNQGGISLKPAPKTLKSDQKRLADFKAKVTAVLTQLDLPISIYAATSRDQYRKPRTGMWQELLEDYDLENAEAIDLDSSVFVGDAGGREAVSGGVVKDHSCSDRDFAANIGIPFHTPEEYFRHEAPRPFKRAFDPAICLGERVEDSTSAHNTNADPDTRAVWVTLAQKLNVPIRCVLFTASPKLCEHNDTFRALNIGPETNRESRTILPHVAFSGFGSRYREPKLSEGFVDILKTDFRFEGSDEQRRLWSKYWI